MSSCSSRLIRTQAPVERKVLGNRSNSVMQPFVVVHQYSICPLIASGRVNEITLHKGSTGVAKFVPKRPIPPSDAVAQ